MFVKCEANNTHKLVFILLKLLCGQWGKTAQRLYWVVATCDTMCVCFCVCMLARISTRLAEKQKYKEAKLYKNHVREVNQSVKDLLNDLKKGDSFSAV